MARSEHADHPLAKLINAFFVLAPAMIKAASSAHALYKRLPIEQIYFIWGTVLCFFGGCYPTTFAALQAADHGGLQTLGVAIRDLSEEVIVIVEENKKDDREDLDGDGVPDAKQVEGKEFVKRKIQLVLKKMNPKKVNDAFTAMYTVWLSVLAVLKIKFATTVTLALTIADFFKKPSDRFLLPLLKKATPGDYQQWCPVLTEWLCKSIGIGIAWRIQTAISALTSACAGGLIMARALIVIMSKGTKNHDDDTNVDVVSYAFAGLGFYWQLDNKFDTPAPLKLLLWPLEIAEFYIRWAVTSD